MALLDEGLRLVAAGQTDRGVALVQQAADAGDAQAWMQLAVWRLIGDPLARDLPLARRLLRRAVEIGHVDAALMEIALTANGSGGPADWTAAVQLLQQAAKSDEIAARHLQLLSAMDLDDAGAPRSLPPPEKLSDQPDVIRYRRLLSPDECVHIAMAAEQLLQPSSVLDPQSGRRIAHPVRTSDGAVIGPTGEDLVIQALNRRLAAASGTAVSQGEPLAVLRYAVGQQYRPHVDTIAGEANQRIKTVLVYLNEGYQGGETVFPAANLSIAPKGGDAVIFTNVRPDGRPDPQSRHAGAPVRAGAKWLATRWIRRDTLDPWTMGEQP